MDAIELEEPWEPVSGMGENAYAYRHPDGARLAFGIEDSEDQHIVKWNTDEDPSVKWNWCEDWTEMKEMVEKCVRSFEETGEFPEGDFN